MLVSNNDEESEEANLAEALADAAKRPPDDEKPSRHQVQVEAEQWVHDAVHGLALLPPQAALEPHRASSNEDDTTSAFEYDEMPMLESSRPSCATPREPILIAASTVDEPVDRLSDSVPEGELHVWVYEARQLSAPWPMTEALYTRDGLRVRCTLLGAVQESPCNVGGNMHNPVWRPKQDDARDGKGGHFAWALGQPEETNVDGSSAGVEASECELEIDVICGERTVGSASVALEDLLLSSKARVFEANASDGSRVIRLSPHWLPLAGDNAGLLQISLEFIPVTLSIDNGSDLQTPRPSGNDSELPQHNDEDDAEQSNAELVTERARQRKERFEPRDLVEACRAMPWLDQRDDMPQDDDQDDKVIVSRSGAVTMYIPTQSAGNSPPKPTPDLQHSPTRKRKPKAAQTSFGLRPGGEQEQLMDKQLWDLYYFGISSEPPEAPGDGTDSQRTTSMASDFSTAFSDLSRRSDASLFSRQASTCASDVLAYNELIQDMEKAIISKEETAASPDAISNQENNEGPSKPKAKSPSSSPTPKLQLKLRRMSLRQPLDRLHSLWHDTMARASSSSSNASNGSGSPGERSPRRRSAGSPGSDTTSPVASRPRRKGSSPSKGPGVVLFDPQHLPKPMPYQRSTSRDQALESASKAERARLAAATGPRRRSLPINTFSAQHRKQMLEQQLQQQQRRSKRAQRQQVEEQLAGQTSLLASVDPPLLSRARSESLHSLTDLHVPKTGDLHGVPITTPATSTTDSSSTSASHAAPSSRTTTRRHSGSNVVYINGTPLCVGKFVNVGNVSGVVRYIGTTRFATGTWVGIELCEQKGKNSGTVDGEKYFSCEPNHGIFIRASRLDLSVQ